MKLKFTILFTLILIITLPIIYGYSPASHLNYEDNKMNSLINIEKLMSHDQTYPIIQNIEENKNLDNTYYMFNNIKINNILNNYKNDIIAQTQEFFDTNNHVNASNLLNNASKYFKNDQSINSLININNEKTHQENLVEYNGKIEFLSFQTLIAFPDKALNTTNNLCGTFDEEKITKNEFEAILDQLYKNNYILVDIYDIISKDNFTKKTLMLPSNKKPIVLTFDNVTYKSNYQNIGEIDKIIIDRNNNIATYTTKKSIQDRIMYDNEFVVILENFIKSHPDFSHNNTRGIIFLSGDNGILGYNTCHKNASYKFEAKRASEVIKKLRSLGWKFGCNNYSYIDETTKSDMDFARELSLWNKEIRTIIGNTPLYAHPYGIPCDDLSKKDLLIADSFKIFFINNTSSDIKFTIDTYTISRIEINGQSLRNEKDNLRHLFDTEKVYDHASRHIPYYSIMQN